MIQRLGCPPVPLIVLGRGQPVRVINIFQNTFSLNTYQNNIFIFSIKIIQKHLEKIQKFQIVGLQMCNRKPHVNTH